MTVKRLAKALYLLIVGLVVFTGALMIARGVQEEKLARLEAVPFIRAVPNDFDAQSAA